MLPRWMLQRDTFPLRTGAADTSSVLEEGQQGRREPHASCAYQAVDRKEVPGLHKTTGQTRLQK